MSPYRGRSLYNHGRSQLARDVAEANRIEAEKRAEADARVRTARQAERDRVRLTREDVEGATAVRIVHSALWHTVRSVNEKSLTIRDFDLMGTPCWRRIGFDRVTEVRRG